MNDFSYCRAPFARFTLSLKGDCYICDSLFVGNIFDNNFEEMWNSKVAGELRRKVLKTRCSDCHSWGQFPDFDCAGDVQLFPEYPKVLHINFAKVCNVRCVMCKDVFSDEDEEDVKVFDVLIEKLMPVFKNVEVVSLSYYAEVFASYGLKKITNVISEVNPGVKYVIETNGLMCDENCWREFSMIDKVDTVSVSLHSCSKQVYDKIVRGGDFDKVMKNLRWLLSLKCSGKLRCLYINFVVFSLNYRDMVKCVKFAKKYAVKVKFLFLQNWKTNMFRNVKKYTVWEKTHKEHTKFVRELKKLKKYDGYYWFEFPIFKELQNSKIGGIFSWFKKCLVKYF